MTLIVGAVCSEGIAIGADSGATFVPGNVGGIGNGQGTAMQPTSKLHVVDAKLVMGVSGAMGLGQKYLDRVEELLKAGQLSQNQDSLATVQRKIEEALWKDTSVEIARANQVYGPTLGVNAVQTVSTHSLIALSVGRGKKPCLLQCDFQGKTEASNPDLPFVAVGSGQPIADPFLSFLRRIFWKKGELSLRDGIFAIAWTLDHAIKESPGGLSEPIEVAILDGKGARLLEQEELDYHRLSVDEFEQAMQDKYFSDQSKETAPSFEQTP